MIPSHEAANARDIIDRLNAAAEEWRERAEKAEREMSKELARRKLLVKTTMCYFDCARQAQAKLADARATVETLQRERDEARERADRAERFCARASTAAGEHGFVCADAVSLRGELASARALIARAVEAIKPFNALTPFDAERPGNTVVQISVYLRDLRRIAAFACEAPPQGEPK